MKYKFLILIVTMIAISSAFVVCGSESVDSEPELTWSDADVFQVDNLKYIITSNEESDRSVAIVGYDSNATTITIPLTINRDGVVYSVDRIARGAFYSIGDENVIGFNGDLTIEVAYTPTSEITEIPKAEINKISPDTSKSQVTDNFGTVYHYDMSGVIYIVSIDKTKEVVVIPSKLKAILVNDTTGSSFENDSNADFENSKVILHIGTKYSNGVAKELFLSPGAIQAGAAGQGAILSGSSFESVYVNIKPITPLANGVITSNVGNILNNCTQLTHAFINASEVKGTFAGCTSLKYFYVGDNVTISDLVVSDSDITTTFSGCMSLDHIVISEGNQNLKYLDNKYLVKIDGQNQELLFQPLSLISVDIPQTVTSFRSTVFSGNLLITEIKSTGSVSSIVAGAFEDCFNLMSVNISSSVQNLDFSAFDGCTQILNITVDSGNSVYSYCNSSNNQDIQGDMLLSKDGKTLHMFSRILTNVSIPDSVETLGPYSFKYSQISSLVIPKNLISIDINGFEECNVSDITVDADNTSYMSEFGILMNYDKTCILFVPQGIINLKIPGTVTEIAEIQFKGRSFLSVEFDGGNLKIGANAFEGCSDLRKVFINSTGGVTLDDFCFANCIKLNQFSLSSSSLVIGDKTKQNIFSSADIDSIAISCTGNITINNNGLNVNAREKIIAGKEIKLGNKSLAGTVKLVKISGTKITLTNATSSWSNGLNSTTLVMEADDDNDETYDITGGRRLFYKSTIGTAIIKGSIDISPQKTDQTIIENSEVGTLLFDGSVKFKEFATDAFTKNSTISDLCVSFDPTSKVGDTKTLIDLTSGLSTKIHTTGEYDSAAQNVTYSGINSYGGTFKLNGYEVLFPYAKVSSNEVFLSIEGDDLSIEQLTTSYGDVFVFRITSTKGLTPHDILVKSNGVTIDTNSSGIYSVSITGETDITVAERMSGDTVNIWFDECGGDEPVKGFKLIAGRTILEEQLNIVPVRVGYTFDGWYLDSEYSRSYVIGTPITENIIFYAKWIEKTNPVVIFSGLHGNMVATVDSSMIESGEEVTSGSTVIFTFTPYEGYEFTGWSFNGIDTYVTNGNQLTVSQITSKVNVGAETRYYSPSNMLTSVTDLQTLLPGSDVTLAWKFTSSEISMGMSVWSMPSEPLIVGDYTYVYVGSTLYKIDIDTGLVVKQKTIADVSAYYRYLGYGNGYIVEFNGDKIYDLDLENEIDIGKDISASFYNDGYFYALSENKLWKFSISEEAVVFSTDSGWVNGVGVDWFNTLGITSAPVFVDDYIYFLEVTANSTGLASVNMSTGVKTTIQFSDLTGRYLDNGWLTYYEGRLYFTTYASSLFDSADGSNSTITTIAINNGVFDNTSIINVDMGYKSITSAFLVFNDRGYVLVSEAGNMYKAHLQVYSITEMLDGDADYGFIYEESCPGSHGSIVLSTAYATDENHNATYIYMLPYQSGDQSIYIFSDNDLKTTAGTPYHTQFLSGSYGSQAIRFTEDSKMIWYSDSGAVRCFSDIAKNPYYFFIQNGDEGMWISGTGFDQKEALLNASDEANVDISMSGGLVVSIDGKTNVDATSMWKLYKLTASGWISINTMSDSNDVNDHYYAIVFGGGVPEKETWYYEDVDGRIFSYQYDERVGDDYIIGKKIYSNESVFSTSYSVVDDRSSISGNKAIVNVNIIRSESGALPVTVELYVKFTDNSYVSVKMNATFSNNVAYCNAEMSGLATPSEVKVIVFENYIQKQQLTIELNA